MTFANKSGEEQVGPDSIVPVLLSPEELAELERLKALEAGIARDEINYALQDDVKWNAGAIVMFTFVALWCLCNIVQGLTAIYRWYGSERIKDGRWKTIAAYLIVNALGVAPLVLKFYDLQLKYMTGIICL
jgi:hypothetical protein